MDLIDYEKIRESFKAKLFANRLWSVTGQSIPGAGVFLGTSASWTLVPSEDIAIVRMRMTQRTFRAIGPPAGFKEVTGGLTIVGLNPDVSEPSGAIVYGGGTNQTGYIFSFGPGDEEIPVPSPGIILRAGILYTFTATGNWENALAAGDTLTFFGNFYFTRW